MKICINYYSLTDNKIKSNFKIAVISDIHSNIEALKSIKKLLLDIKPNYLFIPGDTLDTTDNSNNKLIFDELKNIGDIVPSYITLGNHEYYNNINLFDRKNHNKDSNYLDFFDKLNKNSKCFSFTKTFQYVSLPSFNLYSINLPYEYYSEKGEDFKYLYDILKDKKIDKSKFNILLIHSPNGLIKNNNIDLSLDVIKDMNLILCGHNHSGLVPIYFQNDSHKGFVGPYGTLFPNSSYGYYNNLNTSLLISGGVTKISTSTKTGVIGKIVNRVCMPEVEIIECKNDSKHVLELKDRRKIKF